MNNYFTLTKLQLKLMFSVKSENKSSKWKNILKKSLWLLVALPFIALICLMCYALAVYMSSEVYYLLSTMIAGSQLFVLMYGFAQYISVLYFSKDTEFLSALPIKPWIVFLSKFTTVVVSFLWVSLFMIIPAVITVGVTLKVSLPQFYILGLLASITSPILPLIVITLLSLPLAYVASFLKRNNIIGTIVIAILIAGLFGGYYYLIYLFSTSNSFDPTNFLYTFEIMAKIIYPNIFITTAMVSSGGELWLNLLYYLLCLVGGGAISVVLSAIMYGKCSNKFSEHSNRATKAKSNVKRQSPLKALIIRDVRTCFGSSGMAINYIIGLIILPIIMIFMNFMYNGNNEAVPMNLSQYTNSIAVVFLVVGINTLAYTAYSREGKNLFMMRILPVSNREILKSKLVLSDIYTCICSILYIIVSLAFGNDILYTILVTLSIVIAGIGVNAFSVMQDIKKPKFNWQNARELFKNNMTSLWAMLLCLPIFLLNILFMIVVLPKLLEVSLNNMLIQFVMASPALVLGIAYLVIFRFILVNKFADRINDFDY